MTFFYSPWETKSVDLHLSSFSLFFLRIEVNLFTKVSRNYLIPFSGGPERLSSAHRNYRTAHPVRLETVVPRPYLRLPKKRPTSPTKDG